ncbi:hypothetical protein NJL88_11530 [Streptomyces sp. DK15]|uniref:hypothetical protein n=1 Tax=Streptomyces sp. DK15 TaxID=2957499 RepID=UPI0029B69C40|nr:hypothetical protein [Streptomyces sp. DK15]MDX2390684.1 hypothetical protein [Streptomyces sp. DK15]
MSTKTPAPLDTDDTVALEALETLVRASLTNPRHGMEFLNAIRSAQGKPQHNGHSANELSRPEYAAFTLALDTFKEDYV